MKTSSNGSVDLHDGFYSPSDVHRVIVTDYYDGPVEGLIEFSDEGAVYLFEMTSAHETTPRTWTLKPLPADAMKRFIAVLANELSQPTWPVWVPRWTFTSKAHEECATAATEEILREAGNAEWQITSENHNDFRSFKAMPAEDALMTR